MAGLKMNGTRSSEVIVARNEHMTHTQETQVRSFALDNLKRMKEVAKDCSFLVPPTWVKAIWNEGQLPTLEMHSDDERPEGFIGNCMIYESN